MKNRDQDMAGYETFQKIAAQLQIRPEAPRRDPPKPVRELQVDEDDLILRRRRLDLTARLASSEWQAAYRERHEADVERKWKEAMAWAAGCVAGDCAYASLACQPRELRRPPVCGFSHYHECPGYAGFKSIEEGRYVFRVRYCDRRLKWCRAKTAANRARSGKGNKALPAPRSWQDE